MGGRKKKKRKKRRKKKEKNQVGVTGVKGNLLKRRWGSQDTSLLLHCGHSGLGEVLHQCPGLQDLKVEARVAGVVNLGNFILRTLAGPAPHNGVLPLDHRLVIPLGEVLGGDIDGGDEEDTLAILQSGLPASLHLHKLMEEMLIKVLKGYICVNVRWVHGSVKKNQREKGKKNRKKIKEKKKGKGREKTWRAKSSAADRLRNVAENFEPVG